MLEKKREVPVLSGKDFEDYVAALLQVSGAFVERNISGGDILELDIVATNFLNEESSETTIVEVKSGDWGLTDAFKLKGWMEFLGKEKGLMVYSRHFGKTMGIEKVRSRLAKIGVELRNVSNDLDDWERAMSSLKLQRNDKICKYDIEIWTKSYKLERKVIECLNSLKKGTSNCKFTNQDSSPNCAKDIHDYYNTVNNKVFFLEDNVEKLNELYKDHSSKGYRLSERCMAGLQRDTSEKRSIPHELFDQTFYNCEFNILQISTYVEHKARLSILRTATELLINSSLKDFAKLPGSLSKGMSRIRSEKYFYLYPTFWQWFLWAFGGFILKERENDEYKILSDKTGLPVEEVKNAMEVYNKLFPIRGGKKWLVDLSDRDGYEQKIELKQVILFPCVLRGLGVLYRTYLYGEPGNVESIAISDPHTLDYLRKSYRLAETILAS
ncbi:hypothetical protein JM64_01620 [Fervidobacterium ngatamarikiense]|uniref:Uncharacterized protein n=1 Tax=Fervidobacterium pennivorans TaxID=93466 RepID=A0A172T1H4_FERPE|nr:hypothetical protein [Fervidobacterium pennivorans]ANE40849.1 hypothetical protein JM64_01620 [Fervidobacterium pennivorans]